MVETVQLRSTVVQVAVSILANWAMVNSGIVVGFPSAILPPLMSSDSVIHASINQASWVASLSFMSATMVSLLAGQVVDRVGRAHGLQLLNILFASGWLLMAAWPDSLFLLYLGRLLTGLGLGLASCASATYTAEVTTARLRTALVTLSPIMMAVGTFLVYLAALLYPNSWTEISYFSFGISILSLVLNPLLPESPLWLVNKGRTEKALQELIKLRGATSAQQVSGELQTFTSRAKDEKRASSWLMSLQSFSRPEAYKPLIILNVFFFFQQMSGVGIVIQFGVEFVREAGVQAQAHIVALGIAAARMFSALLTSWLCSHYGRRGPAVVSGAVMAISILSLAGIPYLTLTPLPWLYGLLILLFVLSSSVGFSTLPWSMLGELFPTNVRVVAGGITVCLVYGESFIGTKIYPGLIKAFGPLPIFLFFGLSGLAGTVFLYLCLPETHGKTLAEIEDYFKGKKEGKNKDIGVFTIS